MKVIEIEKIESKDIPVYKVKANKVNVIYGDHGIILLPDCKEITQLKIIFAVFGEFRIEAKNSVLNLENRDLMYNLNLFISQEIRNG